MLTLPTDPYFQQQWHKMLSGETYDATYHVFIDLLEQTRDVMEQFNTMLPSLTDSRMAIIKGVLGSCGSCVVINQPFRCDYACNIHIGSNVLINYNATILDDARVSIGNNVFIGPNVSIYTPCHPLDAESRRKGIEWALPVTIGDDVWIGGSATILPGVTIGRGCVIGAGSVVTHDIAPYTMAAGNPCRHIKDLPHSAGDAQP